MTSRRASKPVPWRASRSRGRAFGTGSSRNSGLGPGLTEFEIAGRLEGALRRHGSEAHPFPTIIASGPRSALPHALTSARTVAAGEWLLLDFGAVVDGYCADVTRTVIVGARADESQRALYGLVQEAQRRAREG